MARVIVVGAGVVGLTCAVRLAEDGHRVDVVGRDLPRETTSAVAAALWHPRLLGPVEGPADRDLGWAARTFAVLADLAADPATGVRMRPGTELFSATVGEPPPWAGVVASLRRRSPTDGLPGGYVDGWTFTAPVVEMPVYLDWLVDRLAASGGTLTRLNLSALPPTGGPDGAGDADLVLDCAGLGARLFAEDTTVRPVRGQVVVVEQVGLEEWWLAPGEDAAPTSIVPRARDIVLGGTEEHGEWSRTPDPATAERILDRAVSLVPPLADARVLRHKVGLRPARPEVRLERVDDVVHCYGHGGAGVTLSWGCADEVAALVAGETYPARA